ncbi:hypothetical protein KPH14_006392 [Odynerus spinipes]|uniref:Uncharacterized protein n=1 Tax=Odynerus spinipes TaxID=1348599 RepID=A0AAD9RZ72_9HYME|nr:hypothetical protein KPH14_006392 [Odynerus spinipes]
MNKTESLNFDGRKNPRQAERKDQSVDARDLEKSQGTTTKKKKSNKVQLWCAKCWKKRKKSTKEVDKKTEKKDEKGQPKKSFWQKIKNSRCWGRKKKKDKDGEVREEKRDSSSYESKAGTSTRDGKRHLIVDKSTSRISFEERRKSREETSKEKKHKPKVSRSEKSVSYADTGTGLREKYGQSSRDITKSCCYLCTENSLAIAAAMGLQPIYSDKSVEADAPEMLEKSCSPMKLAVHVRTVKSLVRVKIRDTCTSYAEVAEERTTTTKSKKKRRKFRIFPKIKRECPVRRTTGCVTENSTKPSDPKPQVKKTIEPCCRDKAV